MECEMIYAIQFKSVQNATSCMLKNELYRIADVFAKICYRS